MGSKALAKVIDQQQSLEGIADTVQSAITNAYSSAGETGQQVKDFLHGTWLGHPLHPVLTDIPIGAWTVALAADAFSTLNDNRAMSSLADTAITVGLLGAVGSAVTGATDWSDTDGRAKKVGMIHGLLNVGASALYVTSLAMRRSKKRRAGVGFAMLGFAISSAAAYLGGHLVFGEQIGVDHSLPEPRVEDFVPSVDEASLTEGKLVKAQAGDTPVLLVRKDGEVCALLHTCTHLGGPLSEGKFDGEGVQCPWHGSRFSVTDGSVLNGPATFPEPCFKTRVRDGKIEVRSTEKQ